MFIHSDSGIQGWLNSQGHGKITACHPQSGGSINEAAMLATTSGQQFFLKHNPAAPTDMFGAEAKSLAVIAASDSLPAPKPYYWDKQYLLMELMTPGTRIKTYWQQFGQQLATMHRHTNNAFGLDFNTYCGTTLQPNTFTQEGHQFFAENRLLPLGEKAVSNGYLNGHDNRALEQLCSRLPQLIPDQPASLIHGDLWSGNAHTSSSGHPVLIDPALCFGWREADIAMTCLFGGFPEAFYQSYHASWPLEKGWRDRCDIYNLFHLLNHLNLFGSGYLGQVQRIINKYR